MSLPSESQLNAVASYEYGISARAALRQTISTDRMATYIRLARGSEERALRLYVRNMALASAFLGPIQGLEVTLRNTAHTLLSDQHGDDWYEAVSLTVGQRQAIDSAKQALRREGKTETPNGIVAATNFGFWVGLFTKRNDSSLWRPVLHRAFNPVPARAGTYDQLDRLRTLRNRIAHHEPIIRRNLRHDHDRILRLLEMLSPEVAKWVRHHSRVPEVLATPLSQLGQF